MSGKCENMLDGRGVYAKICLMGGGRWIENALAFSSEAFILERHLFKAGFLLFLRQLNRK